MPVPHPPRSTPEPRAAVPRAHPDITHTSSTIHSWYHDQILEFYKPEGPPKLLFYHQVPEVKNIDGEFIPKAGEPPKLFVTDGDVETLRDKALYLVRTNPKGVSDKSPENDIYSGEIRGGVLDTLASLVANLYAPVLKAQKEWGKTSRESAYDCVIGVQRFGDTLTSAAHSLQGGVELIAPDLKYVNSIDLKPQAFSDASADPSTAAHFETILTDWCDKTEALLDASEESYAMSAKEDAGPRHGG